MRCEYGDNYYGTGAGNGDEYVSGCDDKMYWVIVVILVVVVHDSRGCGIVGVVTMVMR